MIDGIFTLTDNQGCFEYRTTFVLYHDRTEFSHILICGAHIIKSYNQCRANYRMKDIDEDKDLGVKIMEYLNGFLKTKAA